MDEKISKVNRYPNYRRIYIDFIKLKYPEKEFKCKALLEKKVLSALDVIKLNSILFSDESENFNQKLRSYDETAILEILLYQKINALNNTEAASHFKLSRNTIAKWKRLFSNKI
ncbi:helix-turn-helix domain-containing protein [Chryseobacterium sp. MA9]|uniref:helix-turn-helix domain-containing protein n=1 Tax=Chryseobacterium sp. MA9 TaxID=2966625 RepID=UPI002103F7AC|nr:helix-turn-helix domain-containing protein [Chryseobacterium sp. MA9]UTX49031.1 helix-turn-helix domain-containing protein [Chryseobacterium sp. MA9]